MLSADACAAPAVGVLRQGRRFHVTSKTRQFRQHFCRIGLILLDNFDDSRTGYRTGRAGLQRIAYLRRFGNAKSLQRRCRMVFTQFADQVVER